MTYSFNLMNWGIQKITRIIERISIKSLFILLKKARSGVQKKSRQNVMTTVLIFAFFSVLLTDVMGGKNHDQLKRTALE